MIALSKPLTIRAYVSADQPSFENLNREWIERYFWVEPIDADVLQLPERHIISKGGKILMAEYEGTAVGTVALKVFDRKTYEFTKMAVDPSYRNRGIGRTLAETAIETARQDKMESIILYSHSSLAEAIALYKKLGFVPVPLDGPYKWSDIKMRLQLQ